MDYCFYIADFTDRKVSEYHKINESINHDDVACAFEQKLQEMDKEEICELLACAGFIPDLYVPDSSEETLFSKLIEVLVAEWAKRMGFGSTYLKEKASYEDVDIVIDGSVVVCDAKSFRLGRSQGAPNVKDFLKLEDVRKWLDRHENGLGGLVVYPNTHDWKKGSDAYQYCTTKSCPTVMLSYIYLAVLLHFSDRYDTEKLSLLWDYKKLFPKELKKKIKGGNRVIYWDIINKKIRKIIGVNKNDFHECIQNYMDVQVDCIKKNIRHLQQKKKMIVNQVEKDIENMCDQDLRSELIKYKIMAKTRKLNEAIERIQELRLKER